MSASMRQTHSIPTRDMASGQTAIQVEMEVFGCMGVHRAVQIFDTDKSGPTGTNWKVTHIASGYSIWSGILTHAEAIRLAEAVGHDERWADFRAHKSALFDLVRNARAGVVR